MNHEYEMEKMNKNREKRKKPNLFYLSLSFFNSAKCEGKQSDFLVSTSSSPLPRNLFLSITLSLGRKEYHSEICSCESMCERHAKRQYQ